MIRSVIAAIKHSYKPLCKQESDNQWCRGKLLISIKRAMKINCQSVDNCCIIINTLINLHVKVSNRSITGYHLNTFTIRISRRFSSVREFQILLRTKNVSSLVKIHWWMLILECSQECYGRTEALLYPFATSLASIPVISLWTL
jgi:hypothetical protein